MALPLKQFSPLILYFGNPDSVIPVLRNFIFAGKREDAMIVFMKHPDESCFDDLGVDAAVRAFDAPRKH